MRPPILLQFLEVGVLPLFFLLMTFLVIQCGGPLVAICSYLLGNSLQIIIFHSLQDLLF